MSATRDPASILDARIRVDHLPPEGREMHVRANDVQLLALADLMEVSTIERCEAWLSAARLGSGLHVTGRLRALIVQPCIVTFAPVYQDVDEAIDRIFVQGPAANGAAGKEVFVDLEADDFPDYIEGPEVDLAQLITETLALAIDPYPRAEGASLDARELDRDDDDISPFASLKSLIDPDDKP